MSQAHIDALLHVRRQFENDDGFQFYLDSNSSKAYRELHLAVLDSLEGNENLHDWLKATLGYGEWDDCYISVFDVKMHATHLAWIDQMIIDWKDAS